MRKGDETKREILRAAEQLFCQKGYEAASMQEIVRAAGVSKGGIYHHFASKEEIMTLLSHQHAQESAERAEAQLADAPDDLARLNLLLSACLPMRDEDAAFTAMLPADGHFAGRARDGAYVLGRIVRPLPPAAGTNDCAGCPERRAVHGDSRRGGHRPAPAG